jgi:RNA polymerase sigma-70 factor (ECF subfamily)
MSQPEEFESLVRACQGELFALALARLADRESAKDVLQEVLLSAWQHREKLLALPCLDRRKYLFAMTRNRAIDHGRRLARHASTEQSVGESSEWPAPISPSNERLDSLENCLSRLHADDRELLMLSTIGGLDGQQIADRLGSHPSTIRSRLSRIRRQLRECITAKLERTHRVGS